MRKLLMLAVVVAAAFAVVAAPASAQYEYRLSPNPSFPHDDLDPGNWAAVDATNMYSGSPCYATNNCKLHDGWGGSFFEMGQSADPWYNGYCQGAGYEGGFDSGGALVVSGGPTAPCWTWGPYHGDTYPWDGQTCLNVSTGEAWIRLWVELEDYYGGQGFYEGEMFGRIADNELDPHIEWAGTLNFPTNPATTFWANAEFQLEHSLAFEGRLDETGEAYVPCSWPELQA